MKYFETDSNAIGFSVFGETERSQAAIMTLAEGETTGGPDNRHPTSDQWLYVTSGTGVATVNKREVKLRPGSLLLIEANETHEIVSDKEAPLKTINFYAEPAY